jgi:hypothetical protein
MAKPPKDHLDEKTSVSTEPECIIAHEQLGKAGLPDPVIISRLFKRITKKTLQNIRPNPRRVITRPLRIGICFSQYATNSTNSCSDR